MAAPPGRILWGVPAMMTNAQRQLREELNAYTFDLEERLEATRRVQKWLEQAISQAQPEASNLHHYVNLLLARPSREGRLH
jgi:hypothetical protein